MSTKQRTCLINCNRVVIFALTLVGLFMDGAQPADLPVSAALLMWLWLPHCTRLEATLIHRVGNKRRHAVPSSLSPSH